MGSIHATGMENVQHPAVERTNALPKTLVRLSERFPGTSMSNAWLTMIVLQDVAVNKPSTLVMTNRTA